MNSLKNKNALKKVAILTLIGLALVIGTFRISVQSDMKEAYNILDSTTTYVTEQCNRYSLISLSSESKSLTRLIEGCKFVEEELSVLKAPASEAILKEYVRTNYLTGIVLLDEKGNIVSEYSKDKDTSYLPEDYLKSESLLETAQYPQKQYAIRYSRDNGDELDVAAICRTDKSGIIVAYYHTRREYKESFSLNVESLLEGFTMEKSGTIVISNGDSIVASNDDTLIGKNPNEIEILNKIYNESSNKKNVAAKEAGNSIWHSYGLMKQGRDVFVYAYMPEQEIYGKTPIAVFAVLIIYLIGIAIIRHTKIKATQGYREEQLKLKAEYAQNLEEKNTELQKAVDEANRANAAKSNFLSRMSHDIRTPINGIVGLIKINKEHFSEKELVLENFDKMQVAADYLLSLINDVLQMSKVEDGTVKLSHEFVNFKELASEINTIIGERAAEHSIEFEFSLGKADDYPNVIGSPVHLRQIFLNIYTNAIKYNRPGGKVTTAVEVINKCEDSCVYQWTISDTGIGMNDEFLKYIFEPFTQEKNDARTYYQGVGLGMSIVKGLLDEMGGNISVSSEEGVGTTFVITIPFEIAKEQPKDKNNDVASIEGLHLMLAEDNELNAEIAEIVLTDEGAKITHVNDGQQAIEVFSEHPAGTFDAIIMDVMMPVMDGLTATKKIRQLERPDAKTIPIIAMTANAFEEDKKNCLDAGMNAHIAKPIDMEKAIETISRFCSEKNSSNKG